MDTAKGHFVNIADVPVHYIVYETDEKPFCLIDIFGYGVFRARPMRGMETRRQFKYSNYLDTGEVCYILIEHIPPD